MADGRANYYFEEIVEPGPFCDLGDGDPWERCRRVASFVFTNLQLPGEDTKICLAHFKVIHGEIADVIERIKNRKLLVDGV